MKYAIAGAIWKFSICSNDSIKHGPSSGNFESMWCITANSCNPKMLAWCARSYSAFIKCICPVVSDRGSHERTWGHAKCPSWSESSCLNASFIGSLRTHITLSFSGIKFYTQNNFKLFKIFSLQWVPRDTRQRWYDMKGNRYFSSILVWTIV